MGNKGYQMPPVLCDTVCVWALYFRDSAYRRHVLKLRSERGLVIPDVCLLEAAYPIHRAKGPGELERYAKFVKNLPLAPNTEILETGVDDLAEALSLASRNPDTFTDEDGNLCLFDAIVAALWLKTGMTLATTDAKLLELGEKTPQLRGKAVKLRKARRRP